MTPSNSNVTLCDDACTAACTNATGFLDTECQFECSFFECGDESGCFASSTNITLAGGGLRAVSQLRAGDRVMAVNDAGGLFEDEVLYSINVSARPVAVVSLRVSSGEQVTNYYD